MSPNPPPDWRRRVRVLWRLERVASARVPLAEFPLGVRVRTVILSVMVAAWIGSLALVAQRPSFYRDGFAEIGLAVSGLALVVAVIERVRRPASVWGMRAFVLVTVVLRLCNGSVVAPGHPRVLFWPLDLMQLCGLVTIAAVFSWRVGLWLIVTPLFIDLRSPVEGFGALATAGELMMNLADGLALYAVLAVLTAQLRRARDAEYLGASTVLAASREEHRLQLRSEREGLLHDLILGALRLAARGRRDEAAEMAHDAFAQLDAAGVAFQPLRDRQSDSSMVPSLLPLAPADPRMNWTRDRRMRAGAGVIAVVMGGYVLAGWSTFASDRFGWVNVVGAVALGGLALAMSSTTATPTSGLLRWWPVVALVVVWAGLLGNVTDAAPQDWRLWFLGAITGPMALLGLRYGVRAVVGVAASGTTLGAVLLASHGNLDLISIAVMSFRPLAWGIGLAVLRTQLDQASTRISHGSAERVHAVHRLVAARLRAEEITARRLVLEVDVVPMLLLIVAETDLTEAQRKQCAQLEATAKDLLVAASLITPTLAAAIASARRRGVGVSILGESSDGVQEFQRVALRLTSAARPGDRVILRWHPSEPEDKRAGAARGWASLVGDGVGVGWQPQSMGSGLIGSVTETVDEDSVLIEFGAGVAPSGAAVEDRWQRWLADPLAGLSLARPFRNAIALANVFIWLSGAATMMRQPHMYPMWVTWLIYGVSGAVIIGGLAQWRSAERNLIALRVWTFATLLIAVAAMPFYRPGQGTEQAFGFLQASGIDVVGVAFLPQIGWPLTLGHLVAITLGVVQVSGVISAVGNSLLLLGQSVGVYIVVGSIRLELLRVSAATDRARGLEVQARAQRNEADSVRRWDLLVHDGVLSALVLAARGDPSAANVAQDSLDQLSGVGPTSTLRSHPDEIAAHARRLGLALTLSAPIWLAGREGEALARATDIALSNVARHSGVSEASVSSSWRAGQMYVVVRDEGSGFDPNSVSSRRLGLRDIRQIMTDVGGWADFASNPGRGTTVTLSVTPRPPSQWPPQRWSTQGLAWTKVSFAAVLMASVIMCWSNRGQQFNSSVSLLGFIVLTAASVGLGLTRVGSARWWVAGAGAVAAVVALLVNIRNIPEANLWPLNAYVVAGCLVGIRAKAKHVVVLVALTMVGYLVASTFINPPTSPRVTLAFGQVTLWGILCAIGRRQLDSASTQLNREAAAMAQAEAEKQLALADQQEVARRQAGFHDDVLPMLRQVASGVELTSGQRAECIVLEAQTRDQLVAPTLVNRRLADHFEMARRRGVRVVISGRGREGVALTRLRLVAGLLADVAEAGDRLVVRWRTGAEEDQGSASLTGVDAGPRASVVATKLVGIAGVAVSSDPDTVLVEFHPDRAAD